jgi:hypothetical protein
MVVYRNTSVVVQLEQHIHTWSGYPSSEEYKNTFCRSLRVARKHHVNNWLIDQRALKNFSTKISNGELNNGYLRQWPH